MSPITLLPLCFAETPSPEDLEDTSDKGGMISVEAVDDIEEDLMEDNVERIFVPEHKNQATSPSHPMAEQCEEFVVAAASDSEVNNILPTRRSIGYWTKWRISIHFTIIALPRHCPRRLFGLLLLLLIH